MHRIRGSLFATLVVAGSCVCQDFDDRIASAREAIEDGEWSEALTLLRELATSVTKAEELQQVAARLGDLGRVAFAAGAFEVAASAYRAALQLHVRLHGDRDHANVAMSLSNLGASLQQQGQVVDALDFHRQALAMRRRLYPAADHPHLVTSLTDVAYCLEHGDHGDEALPLYQEALVMRRRLLAGELDANLVISTSNVATCLHRLERFAEALLQFDAALAMCRSLVGDADDASLAGVLANRAGCLESLRRFDEALLGYEAALAMRRRLSGGEDDADVAANLNNLAFCLQSLGGARDAHPYHEEALAMLRRVHRGGDHPVLVTLGNNLAASLVAAGRSLEALPHYQETLAMSRRLWQGSDHEQVSTGVDNLALCLQSVGRVSEALPLFREAVAMFERRAKGDDSRGLARSLGNLAGCLEATGHMAEAVSRHRAALAMNERMRQGADDVDVARSLSNLGTCLFWVGRADEALGCHREALAMRQRLHEGRPHEEVASSQNNVAADLHALGRADEALPHYEASLAMTRELAASRRAVARGLNNVGYCLSTLGRHADALERSREALAIDRALWGDRDHPELATSLGNVAYCLLMAGQPDEALAHAESSLAMRQRLLGDADHADHVRGHSVVARCLAALGQATAALDHLEAAAAMMERLREGSHLSAELQQSWFDDLKRGGVFERLQAVAVPTGATSRALLAAERGRNRAVLDLLEQPLDDPLVEVEQHAVASGNAAARERLQSLREQLAAARLEGDELVHRLTRLPEESLADPERDARRQELLRRSELANRRLRELSDERARVVAAVRPFGRVRSVPEIQSTLREGELLLEYTVDEFASLVYVIAPAGDVVAMPLPGAPGALAASLPAAFAAASSAMASAGAGDRRAGRSDGAAAVSSQRGVDPEGASPTGDAAASAQALFTALVPAVLWERLRTCKRVFVSAHRGLHRLPFEMLVVERKDGKPVYWLDVGPPVSYVPSGSVLHWLRHRDVVPGPSADTLDLLVLGDPQRLTATAGEPSHAVATARGALAGDLERIRQLPPLHGARAEAEAIAKAWTAASLEVKSLIGPEVTEPAVFDLAARARHLHFACHGLAEEYAGQSLSMLVLSQPETIGPANDGLLKLDELLLGWRGRLAACRLVVLSACHTNVGRTHRDDAPQALPIGFLVAGAPAVISSLWAVADGSTCELMVDFYGRLLAGERDYLAAFTAARKALRAKHPEPFRWAPFLYIGTPDPR